jgi:hypothetical protein
MSARFYPAAAENSTIVLFCGWRMAVGVAAALQWRASHGLADF